MNDQVPDLLRPEARLTLAPTAAPRWPTVLLLFGLALAVYLPAALRAQFLGFDDNFFFGPDNPEFRDGLAAVLDPSRPIANAWLPVAHASLWLDYWLSGGTPFEPHLMSLLLHALAAIVLVRLLLELGLPRFAANVVGALFVVHPALAESVAWVSGRKDILAGLFVFAALQQTAVYARRPGAWRALGLALLAALAMYSKATAVVLPLLSLLVCLYVGGDRRRFYAPLVLLLVTVPIAWHHQLIAAAEGTLAGGAVTDRLSQVPGAFLHYLRTTFWPDRLNVLYPEVDTLARFRSDLAIGMIAVAVTALLALATWWRRSTRGIAVAAIGFVVALLPFNTAFPASSIAAADRYLYLALPWASLLVVLLLLRLSERRGPWLAAGLVLPLAWFGGSRAHDFADDATLWQQSLAVDPVNAVAQLNLVYDLYRHQPNARDLVQPHLEAAVAAARYPVHAYRAERQLTDLMLQRADYGAAAMHARAAIAAATAQRARESSPKRIAEADALLLESHLAAFEPMRLDGDEAGFATEFAAATKMAPNNPEVVAAHALLDLAAVGDDLKKLIAQGKPPLLADDDPRGVAADAMLEAALKEHPEHAGLWCAQAEWNRVRDQVLPALRAYRRAQAADGRCVEAWIGAARLLREREQYAEAEKYAREGLLYREDPTLRQELALALVGQVRLDDAEMELEAYMKKRPGDRDTAKVLANVLVGRAYAKLMQHDAKVEVQRLVDRALYYNPDEQKAHLVLGHLLHEEKRFAEAVEQLELAYKLMPMVPDARQQLAISLAALGYQQLFQRDDNAATDAWLRCLEVAPADFDVAEVKQQLQRAWGRIEASGVKHLQQGERAAAAADFRRCLRLQPDQHWESWLLATAIYDDPAVDLGELETLCRQAVAWQEQHSLDKSQQVLLLARTLVRRGDVDGGRALAAEYLTAPAAEAKAQVLAELHRLAGS